LYGWITKRRNKNIFEIEGLKYVKHFYTKQGDKEFFILRDYGANLGIPEKSLELFHKTRHMFSEFIDAVVCEADKSGVRNEYDANRVENVVGSLKPLMSHYLILLDKNGNQLHLTGCSVGYRGFGPHASKDILDELGFHVDWRFLTSVRTFELPRYDLFLKYYGHLDK
jgi:hypothetical protein